MSIYSGFATRLQEQSYDSCIDSLLYILQKRIIKFYQNQPADEQKFISLVLRLHQQMRNMEKNKYLEPKSSQSVNQLVKFMQVFADNVTVSLKTEPRQKVEMPQREPKPSLPQVQNPKKKSIYWVQKAPADDDSNRELSEREMKTINSNNYDVVLNEGNIEFRKTSYNHAHLRGVKMRNSSKSNLSKQKKEKKQLGELKPPRNRSINGYIQDKPLVQSKLTHYAHSFREQTQHIPRQKHKSHQKIVHSDEQAQQVPEGQSQVADIIRQYIMKAKKGHLKDRGGRSPRGQGSKLPDF